jgi:hypothetical protein
MAGDGAGASDFCQSGFSVAVNAWGGLVCGSETEWNSVVSRLAAGVFRRRIASGGRKIAGRRDRSAKKLTLR